jgi:hypothetical protein
LAKLQISLHPAKVDEDGPRGALLRPERELAEALGRQYRLYPQPHRTTEIVATTVQRAHGDGRWFLDANQKRLVDERTKLVSQPAADKDRPWRRRLPVGLNAVKTPKTLIDTVDLDPTGPAAAILMGDEPLKRDEWDHGGRSCDAGAIPRPLTYRVTEFLPQRLAKEQRGGDDVIDLAQPEQRQIAETRTH